jgi:hypothetical protein
MVSNQTFFLFYFVMFRLIFNKLCFFFFNLLLQLVELKNGETYNGHLVNCDTWMNIHLREVICTSKVMFFFYVLVLVSL